MKFKNSITLAIFTLLILTSWAVSTTLADDLPETTVEAVDAVESDERWEVLFDGTSTDAFRRWKRDTFPKRGWRIDDDGSLHAMDRSDDIITRKQYRDFDLRWEWKLSEGANSGVMYRVAEQGTYPHDTGPEYQIIDGSKIHRTSTGSLYGLIKPSTKAKMLPTGQWNTSRIVLQDNQVQHYLNGVLAIEYVWGSDDIKTRISNSKFKDWEGFMQQETGHIGFQSHNSDIWFRNIRIRELSSE